MARNDGQTLNMLVLLNSNVKVEQEDLLIYGRFNAYLDKGHGIRLYIPSRGYKYLHTLLIPDHEAVDHIDHDQLNNLRSNIRGCTKGQNNMNKIVVNPDSGYKGVSWNKAKRKWYARIQVGGKGYISTGYGDKHAAAEHYNVLAVRYHKEFAVLNVIDRDAL